MISVNMARYHMYHQKTAKGFGILPPNMTNWVTQTFYFYAILPSKPEAVTLQEMQRI
jgi:hypothetical protein